MPAGPVLKASASFSSLTAPSAFFAAGSSSLECQLAGSAPVFCPGCVAGLCADISEPPPTPSAAQTPTMYRISALLVLVGRRDLSLQPLVHPADDVLEPLYAVPRLARSRQFVRLAREADHHRRDLPVLQRAEHLFPAVGRRRPVVGVPEDEHQWGRHVADVGDRRARVIIVRILPRRLPEPRRLEQREVGG